MLGVVIFCHSRPELTKESLESFFYATGHSEWKLIVVQHLGHTEMSRVLEQYCEKIDRLFTFDSISDHYLANINYSRIKGYEIAFDELKCEFVLGLEEDTSIAKDALLFLKAIFFRYRKRGDFRGVNLISYLKSDPDLLHTYSMRRFGLSGQAGAIPRKTWKRIDREKIKRLKASQEWASFIEPMMKSGFVIFSNQSRALDKGWGGTSDPESTSNHPHFVKLRQSWVSKHSCSAPFSLVNLPGDVWRGDAVPYRRIENVYYVLRKRIILRRIYRFMRFIGFPNVRELVKTGEEKN